MAARAQRTLLCISVAVLLVTPCCNSARSLSRTGTRGLLSSTSVLEDDPEVPGNDADEGVPTSALEKDIEFHPWARFQAQEVTEDYNPPRRIRTPVTLLLESVTKRSTHLSSSSYVSYKLNGVTSQANASASSLPWKTSNLQLEQSSGRRS